MLVWFPVTRIQTGSVFDTTDYILAYLLCMGLALPLSVLAAASAYHFTRRTDLSLILFAAFAALSLTVWADDWQLCWLNPCVWALSDDFSNFRIFRSVAYMRLTWLTALAGIWALSLLCIRRYGKGLFGSLARSVRRIYRPAVVFVLLGCSVTAYAAQPVVDHSNPDETAMTFWELPPSGRSHLLRLYRISVSRHIFRLSDRFGGLPFSQHLRPLSDGVLRHQPGLLRLFRSGQRGEGLLFRRRL